MIYKRYGTSYRSVDMDFDAKAINDVGFRRNHQHDFKVDELDDLWKHIETTEVETDAEGPVQTEAKQLMLDKLRERFEELLETLPAGGMMIVENESGHDYPKSRQDTKNIIVEGENRLYFHYTMAPPVRLGLYEPKG